ncbi:lytic transglycosylase domain-containing protein (plasmid) [Vibrio scophthalmi]|uniref:lytic transglycosylase domain-containing protein n=1 Tax=Vibrio scophthalmi TaxID=45658 RepID=UPI003EBC89CC
MFFEPDINTTKLAEIALTNEQRCEIVHEVASDKGVPATLLNLIVINEGGKSGTKRLNTNNSWDLGPAQINTIHAEFILKQYPGANWVSVAENPELNISISADILKQCMTYADNNMWEAVGCYNSKTINIKTNYIYRAMRNYDYIRQVSKLNCSKYWG